MPELGRARTALALPPLLVALALLWRWAASGNAASLSVVVWHLLGAALLYGAAHGLRAARFALLGARIVPLRMRTLALLTFNAAPAVLLVPFKLGELYRLQQLAALSGGLARPVLILLLERALDAFVLLGVLVALLAGGLLPPALLGFGAGLLLVVVAGVAALTVLRPALVSLQQYVLEVHFAERALRLLRLVDASRRSVELADAAIRGNFSALLCLTVAIWTLEALMLALLLDAATGGATLLALASLSLAVVPGLALPGAAGDLVFTYGVVAGLTLAAVWPFATAAYLGQIARPGWRPLRPVVLDPPPVRLAAFEPPRSLRLHVPRRSL